METPTFPSTVILDRDGKYVDDSTPQQTQSAWADLQASGHDVDGYMLMFFQNDRNSCGALVRRAHFKNIDTRKYVVI